MIRCGLGVEILVAYLYSHVPSFKRKKENIIFFPAYTSQDFYISKIILEIYIILHS